MLFKPLARALVLVSVCALFTAVASKPARLSYDPLERRTTNVAGTGTQTLKQFNARAMHGTHTRPKRQASPVPVERIDSAAEAFNEDAATSASTSENIVHVSVAPKPTSLSRRLDTGAGVGDVVSNLQGSLPTLPLNVVAPAAKAVSGSETLL